MVGAKSQSMCRLLVTKPKPRAQPLNKLCSGIPKAVKVTHWNANFILSAGALKSASSQPPFQASMSARFLFKPLSTKVCFWPKISITFIPTSKTTGLFRARRSITKGSRPIHSRLGNSRNLSACWPITAKSIH